MDGLTTPFLDDLRTAFEALYLLAPDRVPQTLTVCHCPACVGDETLAQILATTVRDLPPGLIRAYTHSAHGVPTDPLDLVALLPRYLDLMAQGIEVDDFGLGTGLQRFGDAGRYLPGFPGPGFAAAMDRCGALMLQHRGAIGAADGALDDGAWGLVQTLLVGGWPVASLTHALDDLFSDPGFGKAALSAFLIKMACSLRDGHLELWALAKYRSEATAGLAEWLNALLSSDSVADILTAPDLTDEAQLWLPALGALQGRITPALFGTPEAP